MNYITTKAIEPIFNQYQQDAFEQSYILPKLQDYEARFFPRCQRAHINRTIAGSYTFSRTEGQRQYEKPRRSHRANRYLSLTATMQAFAKNDCREKADDWARFFYQPVVLYSNRRKKVETEESPKARYELVELKNPGTHRQFLIQERATNRLVRWNDLPDIDTVRVYLRKHEFPGDKCYSREQFVNDIENENGEIFLCVAKRRTAEFILNLCYALISKPV